jgi:hypothetical protein
MHVEDERCAIGWADANAGFADDPKDLIGRKNSATFQIAWVDESCVELIRLRQMRKERGADCKFRQNWLG